MKIFITGCAKTGTTLVRRLFNAFDLDVHNQSEVTLKWFVNSKMQVAKRTIQSPFSHGYPNREMLYDDLDLIRVNRLTVINVTRNKEDVLKSSNGYVSEERYEECEEQVRLYGKDHIAFTIEYERLLKEPDVIQKELADMLNLTILHKWSSYPDFINIEDEDPNALKNNYSLRPIE